VVDGRSDPRLYRQKHGRHVRQSITLPSPALKRAFATRANGARPIVAKAERDPETSMATRTLVDQNPTMRRADAPFGQKPARSTVAIMAGGPIGVEAGEADGRGRPRNDRPRRRRAAVQKPGARPSGMPRGQRHVAQSPGIDGASAGPKRDLTQTRRNIVDRRTRRVEGIVGKCKTGRQRRRIQTVATSDPPEPRR
jgi:hypothetical protein